MKLFSSYRFARAMGATRLRSAIYAWLRLLRLPTSREAL